MNIVSNCVKNIIDEVKNLPAFCSGVDSEEGFKNFIIDQLGGK